MTLERMDHYDSYLPIWEGMKDLQDDLGLSVFSSGSFHIEGDGPFYFVFTGFATNPEAFRAYELYLERYSDEGSSYDEKDEAIRDILQKTLFGGEHFFLSDDVFFKRISIDRDRETLRLDYRLVSIRQWDSFEEAESVLRGYKLWLPLQKR